jgi:hypothetical protein
MSKLRPKSNNVRQGQTVHIVVIDHGRQMPLKDSFVQTHFVSSQKSSPKVNEQGIPVSIPVNFLKHYLNAEGNRYVFFTRNQAKKALERHLSKIRSEMWIDEQQAILELYDFKVEDTFQSPDEYYYTVITNIRFTGSGVMVDYHQNGYAHTDGLIEFTTMLKKTEQIEGAKKCH